MSASDATGYNKCFNCGAIGIGKFCSECGSELSQNQKNAHIVFMDYFLKMSDIKCYVNTYVKILLSPTKNTIKMFENSTLMDAIRFVEYSATIYMLFIFSKVFVLETYDILNGILGILFLIITWSSTFYLHYKMASRKSKAGRTYDNFVEFNAIFLGFCLPIISIAQLIQIMEPVLGSILLIVINIPLFIYMIRVWKYFWKLTGLKVTLYIFASSIIGSIPGSLIIFILFYFHVLTIPPAT